MPEVKTYILELEGESFDQLGLIQHGKRLLAYPYSSDCETLIVGGQEMPIEYFTAYFEDKFGIEVPQMQFRAIITSDIPVLKTIKGAKFSECTEKRNIPLAVDVQSPAPALKLKDRYAALTTYFGGMYCGEDYEIIYTSYDSKNGFLHNSKVVSVEYSCPSCSQYITACPVIKEAKLKCKHCNKEHTLKIEDHGFEY